MGFEDFYRISSHAAIFNEKGQVLQLKATYGDRPWGLPGGAVDPGENVVETLQRECREEIGQEVRVEYLSGVYFHQAYNSHALIFRCHLLDDTEIVLSSEHSEYAYFDLDDLSKVQRIRIEDCLGHQGLVQSRSF